MLPLALSLQDWGDVVATLLFIVTLVLLVLTAISLRLLARQIRYASVSLRFDAYTRVLQMLEEHREARHLLGKIRRPYTLASFKALKKDEQRKLDNMARAYDQVGLLVKHRAIPLDFLFDFYSRPLVLAWSRLAGYIADERVRRNQPGHMEKFRLLAIAAKLHRERTHPGEETFLVTPDELADWKRLWYRGVDIPG